MHPAVFLGIISILWTFYIISIPSESVNDAAIWDVTAKLPPMWEKVPSDLSAFPLINNVTVINPWDYRQRLAIYKIMVTATEPFMRSFGPRNTGNILWGLPLQHGWQYSTSRLRDFTNATKCGFNSSFCISENSWWASMNYFLSVIPFLGSVKAGLYSRHWPHQIRLTSSRTGRYCTSVSNCSSLASLERWTDFFAFVINTTDDVSVGMVETRDISIKEKMSQLEDKMLEFMWAAHVTSIEDGLVRSAPSLGFMSEPEQKFGQDWGSMVEFIAATHFQTNFNQTNVFQLLYLPPRLLWPGDKPPAIPDLTKSVNKAIFTMGIFRKANALSGGLILRVWKRAMCSAEGRKEGRYLMRNLVENPYIIPLAIARLARDIVIYPCDDNMASS
ncbi:protein LEG1 homolog [Lineus longissimus]|uniref:protein LEG1 homolog n=1 Tax=Lineus longissimus TaxID=88925 RepID=UPI00315C505A